jgi:hypothetical protein
MRSAPGSTSRGRTARRHTRYPRNMKFAHAMSNDVALHGPDLTVGCSVYTPDELGLVDRRTDTAPVAAWVAAAERRGPGGSEG